MPNDDKKDISEITKTTNTVVGEVKEESNQTLQLLLEKVMGGESFTPTSQQFDEILAQRKTVHSYIHEERMQEHDRFKIQSKDGKYQLTVLLVFVLLLAIIVLIWQPDYFTQVLFALLGFAGGFGVGKYKPQSKQE